MTKEVIIAAHKRAGLPSPFHVDRSAEGQPGVQVVVQAIAAQTQITPDIAKVLEDTPNGRRYEELLAYTREAQASYIQAFEALAKSVSRLEPTMATWEGTCLPYMINPWKLAATSSYDTPQQMETETVVGTQEHSSPEQVTSSTTPPESQQPVTAEPREPTPPPGFQRIQTRSLRSCCERVVQSVV